jgi:hypothetical protein
MRTAALVIVTLSTLVILAVLGCATKTGTETSGIYYKPLPDELTQSLGNSLRQIREQKPVGAKVGETIRVAVASMDSKHPEENAGQLDTIRRAGDGAIPMLAELLTADDLSLRLNSLHGLWALIREPRDFTPDYQARVEPALILLFRRSLLDSESRVRGGALSCLSTVGNRHDWGQIPDGVIAGLKQALHDPDETLREAAYDYEQDLGLVPRQPSHGHP